MLQLFENEAHIIINMVKEKKKKQEPAFRVSNSNPKIEEIVEDYPESIIAYPRELFKEQLRKHLLKHKIK